MENAAPFAGVVFFLSYIFFVFFVLLVCDLHKWHERNTQLWIWSVELGPWGRLKDFIQTNFIIEYVLGNNKWYVCSGKGRSSHKTRWI